MDIRISPDAVVSADRNFVVFDAHLRERSVQCSIAREALESYFWAPAGATDAQLLKSYSADLCTPNVFRIYVEPRSTAVVGFAFRFSVRNLFPPTRGVQGG